MKIKLILGSMLLASLLGCARKPSLRDGALLRPESGPYSHAIGVMFNGQLHWITDGDLDWASAGVDICPHVHQCANVQDVPPTFIETLPIGSPIDTLDDYKKLER